MNKLRSVLKKRRAKEDPRVRRRLFSWRMFAMTLLVVSVLSAGNVFALEKLLKMQVFSVVASMGVGSYWVAMAFLAAIVLHLYTCRRFDRPMRALSPRDAAGDGGRFRRPRQAVSQREQV